jgi:Tol biopolymer transport system component
MIAPIHEKSEIGENQWIKIAEAGPEDWANWSPDGKTLYFTSNRDEHSCLWAQKIDPVSHRPIGEAFAALHLHGNQNYQTLGWSTASGRVVMVLNGDSGNVWLSR